MQWKPLFLSVFCVAAILARVDPAGAQAATACTKDNTVFAHVVALDQPITNNRLGAIIPGGMIFALARDVCAPDSELADGQQVCSGQAPTAGNVMVKPYKRPRPIVLRVNQGQCLQIGFTNLLSSTPLQENSQNAQTVTRAASVHVQGLELARSFQGAGTCSGPTCNDGSWVGSNPNGLVAPAAGPLKLAEPQTTYTLHAAQEGAFLLYSTGDTFSAVDGDGGQLAFGLFGAVHVEPTGAEWYRSQVTADDLTAAQNGTSNPYNQPLINYGAIYGWKTSDKCFVEGTCRVGPVLAMSCGEKANPEYLCYQPNEIVHSDLTAMITGPDAGRFPAERPETPEMRSSYALPDRLQPFREFTIIYHETFNAWQAFAAYYNAPGGAQGNPTGGGPGQDQFAINYGMGGIGSEVLANRLGVGPMGDCTSCKFEEFFLTSWAVGDPAMVVDKPAAGQCTAPGQCMNGNSCDADLQNQCQNNTCNLGTSLCPDGKTPCTQNSDCQACTWSGQFSCQETPESRPARAFFPDDPSNVYHSYISDHTKFRILHGGSDLHHVHHQHAHQWLHSPDTSNGDYLDSQSIGPGSAFSLEMTYNASGNVNQTVGDSIFHCHFYPHFAGGMWSLWRVHDVYETGTLLKDGKPRTDVPNRALPDAEIAAGTPIPALVPLPTIPMPPMPGQVRLAQDGTQVTVCDDQGNNCVPAIQAKAGDASRYRNPGFPFFIPGIAGQRAPHPPLDFAKADDGSLLDGGLPRHLILACPPGQTCWEIAPLSLFTDFSKTLTSVQAIELPEEGTFAERLAMDFHRKRLHGSVTPENATETHNAYAHPPVMRKADFITNGLDPVAGAPFADPCIKYDLEGGQPKWHAVRSYKAADIQLDVSFNRDGWHFPQQRMISLWGDVQSYLSGEKPPEPFFFRANSGDCIEYTLANLVPNVYELDDFQVRTPTDIIGQHIHLVKFDVTSSDGATNGFNYEDGTFAPNEVTERIVAINAGGNLTGVDGKKKPPLKAKTLPFFGPGPGGRWMGAQATVQRWYTDRLFDGTIQKPGVDRTLRTVFTHDHFGPSTHQQAGLYAGLVIEPEDARWFHNEGSAAELPFGGDDPGKKNAAGYLMPLPSRTVTGPGGAKVQDGGPTTWQAVIEPVGDPKSSFREFLFEFQDTMLAYEAFNITSPPSQGFCSDNGAICQPATDQNMSPVLTNCKDPKTAVCYAYGFCSNNTSLRCQPATSTSPENLAGCNLAAGAYATCNLIPGIPSTTWKTQPLDNGGGLELITLQNSTFSFSVNYRNEPLFLRIDNSQGSPNSPPAGDLSYAYASIERPGYPQPPQGPYPPLTKGVGPYDPFTPLLRAYAGDDVQIRTLVGAHINPHNFTVHGVKWLEEPSFVDSGWRNSEVMGISEHFEEIFRLPSVTGAGNSDYLYMPGAAAAEQAGGSWGLMRAYAKPQPDLRSLPQNRTPAAAPVCDSKAPQRSYEVVALTAKQALPDKQLVYNSRGTMADPNAILYFQLADLKCPVQKGKPVPDPTCTAKLGPNGAEPLVLRANAGDCLKVTLYNMVQGTLGAGASSPVNYCGSASSPVACNSNTSTNVGLHPQLVSFDVRTSNGFNVGNNPDQIAKFGQSKTYTWYAGNIDPKAPAGQRHIPIEFGAANLLPSDTINHHQYGLFGALIIEPRGSFCVESGQERAIETCRGTQATIRHGGKSFKEFVVITQDGLSGPLNRLETPFTLGTAWLVGDQLNAVNYRSELLFLPKGGGGAFRRCSTGDVSCVLSDSAQCCTSATTKGACSTWETCGKPKTPVFEACAGEQARFRVLHPGGINTNQVFELHGHSWQEQPYMSTGKGCAKPAPTTQTNLYASSQIGTENGCDPLEQDTYSEYQGSRMGHGPTDHFDVLIESAGGTHKVPGDYLYRTYPADHFRLGLWGIFRVKSCTPQQTAATGTAPGGEGR